MKTRFSPSRRKFIITSGVVGTGLMVGFRVAHANDYVSLDKVFKPNIWITIDTAGHASIVLAKSEMGQGVMTALPMLIAEELEIPWNSISVKQANSPLESAYGNQTTGGSGSVRGAWEPLREAGAVARILLTEAAAKQWGVDITECEARSGKIYHKLTNKNISYGELVNVASTLPLPKNIVLKSPKNFRTIGTNVQRTEGLLHVTGQADYGTDVRFPGQLTAIIVHCPVFGGSLKSFDASEARRIKGVRKFLKINSGIAIVADNYWAAKKAKKLLDIRWNEGQSTNTSSNSIREKFINAMKEDGAIAQKMGDVETIFDGSRKIFTSEYELPFQAHATMEPMSCTADIAKGKYEIWAPTQSPRNAYEEVFKHGFSEVISIYEKVKRKITGKSPDSIRVNTTHLGCGFGRRLQQDYVAEAVQISRETGSPIRLVWPREEDMQHDFYRPANFNQISAILNDAGKPVGWRHKIVGPSISDYLWGEINPGEVDSLAVEGAINLPYEIDNIEIRWIKVDTPVPIGMWRSVGHSQNAFVVESFIDELANHTEQDSLEYRLSLLDDAPQHKAVLEMCAEEAAWGNILAEGHFQGLAVHKSYYTYVAHIVDLSVEDDGYVRVHKVISAIDCGTIINPDMVKAQIEGSIVFGLNATLKGAITIENGRVKQSNFNDNQILRIKEMPEVEVHFIQSKKPPTGVGEPGVPPIAPAITNAIFSATRKRIRRLPVSLEDLK